MPSRSLLCYYGLSRSPSHVFIAQYEWNSEVLILGIPLRSSSCLHDHNTDNMSSLTLSPSFDTILRNSNVNGAFVCDIGIQDSIITSMGLNLPCSTDTEVIDCEYAVVTPGGVDGHFHLSQDQSNRAREARYVAAHTSNFPALSALWAHNSTPVATS